MTTATAPSGSNPPWYISGLGGALGQIAEVTLGGHFLNRIATAQQARPDLGIRQTTLEIYRREGFRGFLTGYRWNASMSLFKGFTRWSINNGMFAFCGAHIPQSMQKKYTWLLPTCVGIGGAAFETTVYLCPLESLKTREMTADWGSKTRMWTMVRAEGPTIFFRGWTGLFPRQAITWATYLIAYDKYRSLVIVFRKDKPIRTIDKFAMNFMTGATAACLTTPFELYKTQRQKVKPIGETNMLASMSALVNSFGYRGVFRSLPMRVARSGFYSVITFTVMDTLNALPSRMKI